MNRLSAIVVNRVVHAGEQKAVLREQRDDVGRQLLSGIQLHERALAVHPLKERQQVRASEEHVVLEALNIHFQHGGRAQLLGGNEVAERGYRDGERGGLFGAGEERRIQGGDGQERRRVVFAGDVHGEGGRSGAEGGLMQRDLGVAGEDAAEEGGGSGKRLKGEDAGARGPVTSGESELAAIGAGVDHRGEAGGEDEAMLDAGEDAMLQDDAGETRGAKHLRDFGKFRQRAVIPGILIETDGPTTVRGDR